jgi:hypothetical protein
MNSFKALVPAILLSCSLQGQLAIQLEKAAHQDSSYYDVFRLKNGSIWLGGEFGIIKQLNGNKLEKIEIPNNGSNILKIAQVNNQVFIAADQGTLYRYDLNTKTAVRKVFRGFENLCFYDILPDADGKLLVCGGSSGIGKGKIRIPRGFIARIDSNLTEEPEILWESKFHFVWSLCRDEAGEIAAAIYNGRNTKVSILDNQGILHPKFNVKGLVHSLNFVQNKLMYCGTPSFRYKNDGTYGVVGDLKSHTVIKNSGFLSGLVAYNELLVGYSQQGKVYNLITEKPEILLETNSGAVYEAVADQDGILFVGHGKSCFRMVLK